jgi:hypothetical protein
VGFFYITVRINEPFGLSSLGTKEYTNKGWCLILFLICRPSSMDSISKDWGGISRSSRQALGKPS